MNQCKECSKDTKTKFCSRSCSAKHNNRLFPKRTKESSCKSCSTPISSSRAFCSPTCRQSSKPLATKQELKTCIMCRELFPRTKDFFYVENSGKVGSYCRPCSAKERTIRIQKTKQKCVDYKGGCCQACGFSKHNSALEFHHLDPSQKDFGIGSKTSKPFESLKAELDKCALLCSNCHRMVHAGALSL